MKIYILLLGSLLFVSQVFAGGMSAWQEPSPYGRDLVHDGTAGGWVCMEVDTSSVCFQHFYFYKGHTIASGKAGFFIINEKTGHIQKFATETQWQNAISREKLKPFWKREYNDNYGLDKFWGALLLVLVPVPLLLPLLWLFCLVSLAFSWNLARSLRKHFAWIYPVLILLVLFYDLVPQSF